MVTYTFDALALIQLSPVRTWGHESMCEKVSIAVSLRLAGRADAVGRHVVAWLLATTQGRNEANPYNEVNAPVVLERATGEFRLGPTNHESCDPTELRQALTDAMDEGWRTGRNVEVLDETGYPLLRGALHEHPGGIARWLEQYRHHLL
jgi:hypothetical protein